MTSRTIESNLQLRNALATAADFDMLDTLEAFDAGDVRACAGAISDWQPFEDDDAGFASARDVFGAVLS